MAEGDTGAGPREGGGLLASLQRLVGTLLEILQTRVEIVATEFEEERERLRQLVVYGFLSLFFISLGLVLLTLFVVMAFWETHRLYVLGGFAVLYLALGWGAAGLLRSRHGSRPRLFAATLAELRKDREQVTPRP